MSKIIEFTKHDKEPECQHEFIKIHDDGIYCNECDIALNKMWLIRNLKNCIFPKWKNVISVKGIQDGIERLNLAGDSESLNNWIDDLKKEAESFNREIANQQQRLLEIKSQQDLFGGK